MDWLRVFLTTGGQKKRRKKKELFFSQRTNNVRKRNSMTNWFFGMVTILQFVTIKMSRKWRCGKNLKGRFASDFKLMRSLFLIFDSATNSSPIVNCQIVNNCCHDKDLKEIFKSDAIRLVVSFKSLSMQTSSIYKLMWNLYNCCYANCWELSFSSVTRWPIVYFKFQIIIAVTKIWKRFSSQIQTGWKSLSDCWLCKVLRLKQQRP